MLVLTRKYQEKIRIGNNITITVLRTKGKTVRLGIEAPDEVPVVRGELDFENLDNADAPQPQATRQSASTSVAPAQRAVTRRAEKSSSWAAESPIAQSASEVGLQRVPRDQVAGILPRLVTGNGPLRTMMNRRRD